MLYNRTIRKRTDLLFGSRRRMREYPRTRRLLRIVPLEQRSQLSVSDGENNTAYTYDTIGRLSTVTSQAGATTYSYDVYGNLAKVVTATGSGIITTTYEYDVVNRLTRLTNFSDANNNGVMDEGEGVSQFDYTLDALGKKTHATETFWFDNNEDGIKDANVNNIDWSYDQQSRLVREVFDHYDDQFDQTLEWTYDEVGNRLTQNLDKGNDSVIDELTRYYYDANDRLIDELFDGQNDGTFEKTTTYGYDKTQQTAKTVTENGVITSDSTFEYNAVGQMSVVTITKYTDGVASSIERTTYGYGSDGIRISALQEIDSNADGAYDTATLTEYLNDPNNHTGYSQVLKTTEYSIDGETRTITKEIYYTIGLDQIAQSVTAYIDGIAQETDHHYFTYDGHGSTRALLDVTAAILQLYSFDAYGNAIDFNPTEALTEYLYSGEQFDSKIGQQYLRARYYDPATGRFNSLDSFFGNLDDPQSLHKYLYTHADPVNGIDPSGLSLGGMVCCIGIGASIGAGIGGYYYGFKGALVGAVAGASLGLSIVSLAWMATATTINSAVNFIAIHYLSLATIPIILGHYNVRGKLNKNYEFKHLNEKELQWFTQRSCSIIEFHGVQWVLQPESKSKFHARPDDLTYVYDVYKWCAEGFLHNNAGREIVFYKRTPRNSQSNIKSEVFFEEDFRWYGTYNYSQGDSLGIHFLLDVIPYWILGNSIEDSPFIGSWSRFMQSFK